MKRTATIFLIIMLVLLNFCVGWTYKPIESNSSSAKPSEKEMPLTINPHNIDLSSLPAGQSFNKTVTIYNPNTVSARVELKFISKFSFGRIEARPSKLTIAPGAYKSVNLVGKIPSATNFQAKLVVENKLNKHKAYCLVSGCRGLPNQPRNVKVTYDYNSKVYTINWDPIAGVHHYNLYIKKSKQYGYELLEELAPPRYIRKNVTLEEARKLKFLIRGVDHEGKTTAGTVAQYNSTAEPPLPAPKNINVQYDPRSRVHTITWEALPEIRGSKPHYYVYCKYKKLHGVPWGYHMRADVYTNRAAVRLKPDESIYSTFYVEAVYLFEPRIRSKMGEGKYSEFNHV